MRTIDEIDLEILRLLLEDARRPYSEIADHVDVSAPTVSDRIDRLRELGVVERFTLDVDRTTLSDGVEVLVDVELAPNTDDRIADRFGSIDQVEHVFLTADARLLAIATVPPDRVRSMLRETVDAGVVDSYRVHLLEDRTWSPSIGAPELALSCDECSNPVTSDGVSVRIDDDLYHFCCPTCRSNFEERYAALKESA